MDFPQVKKKIKAFIKDERGRISKQAIMTVGAIVTTAAAASLLADESEARELEVSVDKIDHIAKAEHSHHGNHGNHSSY